MRLLNHVDIICAVADGQSDLPLIVVLDEVHNIRFLFWGHTTCQHNITLVSYFYEILLQLRTLVQGRQRSSSDDQCLLLCSGVLSNFRNKVFNLLANHVFFTLRHLMLIHIRIKKPGRVANIDGSSNFVASEHPNLDSSSLDELNDLSNLRLQPVLNGS